MTIKWPSGPVKEILRLTGAFLAAFSLSPPGVQAQQQVPLISDRGTAAAPASAVAVAVRTDAAPVIDGVPHDAVWMAALPLTDFTQREPADGQPAAEATELRILFDEDAVYLAVWAWDSQANAIVPGESIRDYEVTDADAVIMIFDTYDDQQNGFVFGTTPVGIEYDGQVAAQGGGGGFFLGGGTNNRRRFQRGAGGGFNKNWDGSWTVAASRDADGWYAEFRIPFSTLRYGSGTDTWGFNVSRRIRRFNEEDFWSAVPREFGLYRLDFAQVEVDDQQVNLTRFSLLFPEKRPFFLENAGFFTVGAGGADHFFSRRIGILEGRPLHIQGGGRLSGRLAGLNVGLLHILTGANEPGEPENAYSVVRIAKELPNRSRVGGLFVNRAGSFADDYNRTYAVDGRLGIGDQVTLTSFVARTDTPGLDGADPAWDVTAAWSSRAGTQGSDGTVGTFAVPEVHTAGECVGTVAYESRRNTRP